MSTRTANPRDGLTGLYLLVLLTVALVAGQARGLAGDEDARAAAPPAGKRLLTEPLSTVPATDVRGAIRELRVLPSILAEAPEFDWSSDDDLLERYPDRDF